MATPVHVPAAEQLRTAISILASAAGDRHWGSGDVVSVRTGGRLRIGNDQRAVDAVTVYMAARGLVGALLDDLAQTSGRELDEIVRPWLVSLQVREALAEVDVDDAQLG
jgi:hypothetical protein